MSKYRQAAKVDTNQAQIVKDLRKLGYSVVTGMDDLIIGHAGKTYWYELKSPDSVSKRTGKILDSAKKEGQKTLEREFKGHYRIVSTIDEILEDLQPSIY